MLEDMLYKINKMLEGPFNNTAFGSGYKSALLDMIVRFQSIEEDILLRIALKEHMINKREIKKGFERIDGYIEGCKDVLALLK